MKIVFDNIIGDIELYNQDIESINNYIRHLNDYRIYSFKIYEDDGKTLITTLRKKGVRHE